MKQCPKCGTNYTDDTLSFCLSDGTPLPESEEQATFVRPGTGPQTAKTAAYPGVGQMRVDIPQTSARSNIPTATIENGPVSWVKVVAIVGVLSVMLIAAAGIAGALIYFNKDARPSVPDSNSKTADRSSPTPNLTPTTSPTVSNNDANELKEQIANLEKRLNEQKNANIKPSNIPSPPEQPTVNSSSALVNSPGDGFLALRTMPSSNAGDRIYAIPSGARVFLNGCLATTRVGNKTGRWCRARYGTYSGWVFDAWLVY